MTSPNFYIILTNKILRKKIRIFNLGEDYIASKHQLVIFTSHLYSPQSPRWCDRPRRHGSAWGRRRPGRRPRRPPWCRARRNPLLGAPRVNAFGWGSVCWSPMSEIEIGDVYVLCSATLFLGGGGDTVYFDTLPHLAGKYKEIILLYPSCRNIYSNFDIMILWKANLMRH